MKSVLVVLLILYFLPKANGQENIHHIVDSLILEGNFELAEKLALDANKNTPNDPWTMCALACVYRNMSYKEVVNVNTSKYVRNDESSSVIDLVENNFNDIFSSRMYFEDSTFSKAEMIYFDIIKINPEYRDAYMNLINAYENDNEFEDYFKTVKLYIDNNKKNDDTKYILLDLASKLFNKNKLDEALRMYEYTIAEYPTFSECIADLGAVFFKQGEYKKSKEQFDKAIAITPNDTLVIDNLIKLNIVLGNYQKAYEYSKSLVTQTKSNFNNFSAGSLSVVVQDNDRDKYLENFIETRKKEINKPIEEDFWLFGASTIKNSFNDTAILKEFAYQFYSNNYHFDLLVFGEIIDKTAPNDPYVIQLMTSTYEKLGYTDKVIQMLKKIESLNSNEEIMPTDYLMFNFGRNYYVAKDYNKSIDYMLKVRSADHKTFANYLIGESYYYLEDFENSLKYHRMNEELNDKNNLQYVNLSLNRIKELEKK